jgi:sugar phosphate isomerase/epimerase
MNADKAGLLYFSLIYTTRSKTLPAFSSINTSNSPKMAPITRASVQTIPLSYASCSIGCGSSDTLPRKLEAISKAGFTSIELSFPDILEHAAHLHGHSISADNFSTLVTVADGIRKLCDANSLTIMMLQPFANFEGWPNGSTEREDAFTRARGWIEIMKVLGTDMLQV